MRLLLVDEVYNIIESQHMLPVRVFNVYAVLHGSNHCGYSYIE